MITFGICSRVVTAVVAPEPTRRRAGPGRPFTPIITAHRDRHPPGRPGDESRAKSKLRLDFRYTLPESGLPLFPQQISLLPRVSAGNSNGSSAPLAGEIPPATGPLSASAQNSLAGERVVFTGILASMTHREAWEWVERRGGLASEHVSRQTTLLVIGEEGWPLEADGRPSVKLQQAQRLLADGQSLRIASESEWLGFVGLDDRLATRAQIYTPASISQLLKVSVHAVRRWERLGLIQPVRRVHRLPYFDLRQVASAQRLAELLAAGVPADQVRDSLQKLTPWVGDSTAALAQLELLEQRRELAYRDRHGRLITPGGQRLIEFEPAPRREPRLENWAEDPALEHPSVATPGVEGADREPGTERLHWGRGEWFEEGQRLSAEGNLSGAIESLRMSLMLDYDFPEVHFQLADLLYQQGHERAALERYYMAVELDRDYPEAWTQIGCVHAGLDETDQALLAFEIALDVHPDYAEAHFHRAEALWKQGRYPEACRHFTEYLQHDQHGPWADLAETRLQTAPQPSAPSSPSRQRSTPD